MRIYFHGEETFVTPLVVLCYFQLLTIFVTGKIKQYVEFYNANKDFVTSLGKRLLL